LTALAHSNPMPSSPQRKSANPYRGLAEAGPYFSLGAQIAGTLAGLTLLGYWLDGRLGTRPWLMLAGIVVAFLGIGALLYRLAKQTAKPQKDYNGDGKIGLG